MTIDDIINIIIDNPIIFIGLCIMIYFIVYKMFTSDVSEHEDGILEKEFDEFMKQTYHDIKNKEKEDKLEDNEDKNV